MEPLNPRLGKEEEAVLLGILRGRVDFLRGDFTLASGKKSDFYINGKTTTLRPDALYCAARIMLSRMAESGVAFDRVGGLTLGADALIGAMVCLSHGTGQSLEGFIVRKEAKGHGTGQWIEGPALQPGQRVAIIEDVVTTGKSALAAIERAKESCPGIEIAGVFALVDRLDGGAEALQKAGGYSLNSLFTKDDLL